MKINKEWHESRKMPRNPNLEDRINWHVAREQHCHCRPIPDKLKAEMPFPHCCPEQPYKNRIEEILTYDSSALELAREGVTC